MLFLTVNCILQYVIVFSSYGRGCSSELFQAVDRFLTPTPLRNPHPTGSAKGCRDVAKDILVLALAGQNKPHYLRKVTEGNPKTTEDLVFSTPAIRYTLKFLI